MSKAIALVGDWNATPRDQGRWSPSWVAQRAGLVIHSTGPGRHGDIDYLMTDAKATHAKRYAPPAGPSRSDHDVVAFTVYGPGPAMTVASWNVKDGRSGAVVHDQVRAVLTLTGADVLALQEASDYHGQLRLLGEQLGYRVLAYPGRGRHHNVLMVRNTLAVARPLCVQLSPRGWDFGRTTDHAELYATSWAVDWLRVVVVHLPPSVNWRRGVIYGPVLRVAAYVAAARRLVGWVRANRKSRR